MTPEIFLKLKREAEESSRRSERIQGELEALRKQVKAEHGVSSLADAEKLLAKMRKESDRLGKAADEALVEYEGKWGNKNA